MTTAERLSDFDHPTIQAKAKQLTSGKATLMEKIESIFNFVRDEIRFGFPSRWDEVKASETIQYGLGYCNTKASLFLALCKASDIPARVHTSHIDLSIMRGIFPGFAFPFLPKTGGHSWMEVEVDGEWKPIDSYINDKPFYLEALKRLQASGQVTGYSISLAKGKSSCEFNFGEQGFVHMGAVVVDHGTWDDYAEYMASDLYYRMNPLLLASYPIMAVMSNRTIQQIRGEPVIAG